MKVKAAPHIKWRKETGQRRGTVFGQTVWS